MTIINNPVLEHSYQQQQQKFSRNIGIKSSSQLIGCILGNTGLTKHHRQSSQPQWQGPTIGGNIMINRNYSHACRLLTMLRTQFWSYNAWYKRYCPTDYATIRKHHIIKGPRTNIRSCAGLAHIMRSHILFTRRVHYHSLRGVATY